MNDFDPLASIQRFYDAENEFVGAAPDERDIRVMLNELDPDVVVSVPTSLPHGGSWHGHAGFKRLFDVVTEHWQTFEVVYDETTWHQIDDGRLLTEGQLRAVLRANGRHVNMPVVSLFTFSSRGLLRLDHFYQDTAVITAPNGG